MPDLLRFALYAVLVLIVPLLFGAAANGSWIAGWRFLGVWLRIVVIIAAFGLLLATD